MRAVLCYCVVVWSQHRGELQHLVGYRSACDWCNTWTESLCLFSFPQRGYMALCVLGTSIQLGSDSAFLACCPILNQPRFSFSFFCLGSSSLLPPDLELKQTPPMNPNSLPRAPLCILGGGGNSFIILFFLSSPSPSFLFQTCSHFLKHFTETRALGFELMPQFPKLMPHLASCRASPVVV